MASNVPKRVYNHMANKVNEGLYNQLSDSGWGNIVQKLTVPKQQGLAWELRAGQTCRVVVGYGPQVGDINVWNLHDPKEMFYSGKTRAIHRTHLTTYDRLWSTKPYLRPLATVTKDSLSHYGFDQYGCSVHDVIGTRCDPYMQRLTESPPMRSCHQNIMEAIQPWGLKEEHVHDVFNIFMCTGYNPKGEYICRGSPAKVEDNIEILAEMDLLVALSACPYGDVSAKVGDKVQDDMCFPLDVYIGQPDEKLLEQWRKAKENK